MSRCAASWCSRTCSPTRRRPRWRSWPRPRTASGSSSSCLTEEAAKHPDAAALGYRTVGEDGLRSADLCLVFGGDGTILRGLSRLLGSGVPTLGVNYGNVGFLASLPRDDWEAGLDQDPRRRLPGRRPAHRRRAARRQALQRRQRRHPEPRRAAPRAPARVRGGRRHRGQHVLRRPHHRVAHRVHRLQPLVRRPHRRVERRSARAQLHRARTRWGSAR